MKSVVGVVGVPNTSVTMYLNEADSAVIGRLPEEQQKAAAFNRVKPMLHKSGAEEARLFPL